MVIERKGRRVVLRREAQEGAVAEEKVPDDGALIQVKDEARADTWTWVWDAETGEVVPDDEGA